MLSRTLTTPPPLKEQRNFCSLTCPFKVILNNDVDDTALASFAYNLSFFYKFKYTCLLHNKKLEMFGSVTTATNAIC